MPDKEISSTSSTCSSNGSTISHCNSTITCNTSECSSIHHHHQLITPRSSPLKLQADSDESKLSSQSNLDQYAESKLPHSPTPSPSPSRSRTLLHSPSPGRSRNHKGIDSRNNEAVKKSMGLMKLRRQGSHGCSSSLVTQASAARELMASLERLSVLDQKASLAMKNNGAEDAEGEAQSSLLGDIEDEIRVRVSKGSGMQGLPLCVKIAAAMDAEGRIGVQSEIACRVQDMKEQLQMSISPATQMTRRRKKKKRSGGAGRWIIRPKLRSTRALLGKIWRNIKRVFSTPTKARIKQKLLSTSKH